MCLLRDVSCVVLACLLLIAGAFPPDEEKRPGQWNKAMNLWGKRSENTQEEIRAEKRPIQNWSKLNTLWGKRSDSLFYGAPQDFQELKRGSWQTANGLWGRRK